jgi:NADPH:quinone reductase-like Zn-dependent oxidoreductase
MRAVQFSEFGSAEQLRIVEAPVPEPGPGQVRVAVKAAGVNALDWKIRRGLMAQLFPVDFPHTPGIEVAGVVDAVGEGAPFAPGDEVFGWSRGSGSYAEYALATVVAAKPAGLSWTAAAALPVAGETALRALNVLGVDAGDTVLIHGASGAVGSLAVQFAVARGAVVIGTTGEGGDDYVRSLGAIPIRYGEGLVERVRSVAPQVDAVLDAAGSGVLPDAIELRGGTDRVLTIADPAAIGLGVAFTGESDENSALLADLAEQAVSGKLRVKLGASFPLEQAAAAQDLSETGHAGGKLTIEVGP